MKKENVSGNLAKLRRLREKFGYFIHRSEIPQNKKIKKNKKIYIQKTPGRKTIHKNATFSFGVEL